jgi:hypothetical protein
MARWQAARRKCSRRSRRRFVRSAPRFRPATSACASDRFTAPSGCLRADDPRLLLLPHISHRLHGG